MSKASKHIYPYLFCLEYAGELHMHIIAKMEKIGSRCIRKKCTHPTLLAISYSCAFNTTVNDLNLVVHLAD
jgi:hypothetical protein